MARIEAFADKKAEAHRILEGVLAREPKNVEALLLRGQLFLSEDNTVNALTTLQTAVAGNPNSIAAHIALAQTHALRGSVKEAMKSFNDALKIDGNNSVARVGLAKLQLATGAAADAVPLLMKVVAENPGNLEAQAPAAAWIHRHRRCDAGHRPCERPAEDQRRFAGRPNGGGVVGHPQEGRQRQPARPTTAHSRPIRASYQALAGLLNAEMQGEEFRRRPRADRETARAEPQRPESEPPGRADLRSSR